MASIFPAENLSYRGFTSDYTNAHFPYVFFFAEQISRAFRCMYTEVLSCLYDFITLCYYCHETHGIICMRCCAQENRFG